MSKDFDSKLLKNILDEINRLNETLLDLERYKDELTEEEIAQTKEDTLKQLIETQKILEKMKKKQDEEKDEYLKGVYHNYILYGEALYQIACNKYIDAKKRRDHQWIA